MAGHNKWSKVKRQKAVTDGRKGKVFSRLSRDITQVAKSGGGDADTNARLRTLLLKAREANMPVDNVERAIKKGTGELPGVSYDDITYEAYGPGGVAFIVQVTTDNKNRTAADIRSLFTRAGGSLGSTGSVAFQFLHAGQFLISKDATTEDALMEIGLDAGADDIITTDEGYELRCEINVFDKVLQALAEAGIETESSEIAYIPMTTIPVDAATIESVEKLHDALDELDDVQHAFSNEDSG